MSQPLVEYSWRPILAAMARSPRAFTILDLMSAARDAGMRISGSYLHKKVQRWERYGIILPWKSGGYIVTPAGCKIAGVALESIADLIKAEREAREREQANQGGSDGTDAKAAGSQPGGAGGSTRDDKR